MNSRESITTSNLSQPSVEAKPGKMRIHRVREAVGGAAFDALIEYTPTLARVAPIRRLIARIFERHMRTAYRHSPKHAHHPPGIEADKLAMGSAILHTVERALTERRLADATLRGTLNILGRDILIRQGDWKAQEHFRAAYGSDPPGFLLIGPGKVCNLRCVGCYANSASTTHEKLDWATFDRIVGEAHDLWGVRFFVITGGEPLAYKDKGKGVLDMAEKHQDCFFLMYTNGTLIDDDVARRLGEMGNITPALSVEGMRERTDERRGAGVFDRVIAAMTRLRREKVLFGLSMTATRHNAEELLSDELIDFFFEEMGALYAWIFHYMPIGRAYTLDLMPTPEQRVWMWQRMWQLVRERRLFIADFWNSGTASDGCISAGRSGGYLYIDWNGAVSPCVFMPYSPVNIRTIYAQGKTLNDVWQEPFFAGIRTWQQDYGFEMERSANGRQGNWLMPCPIRDHHADFHRLVIEHEPEPTDENARAALQDPKYHEGLEEFDRTLAALVDPFWESCYLHPTTQK